jgi:hypothetical protein
MLLCLVDARRRFEFSFGKPVALVWLFGFRSLGLINKLVEYIRVAVVVVLKGCLGDQSRGMVAAPMNTGFGGVQPFVRCNLNNPCVIRVDILIYWRGAGVRPFALPGRCV